MVPSKPNHVEYELPPVDERLVVPETRYEMFDGELVHVPPADPPHATRHSKVSALVEAHAGSEFQVASDMLTRTSRTSDIAPDVSVFPLAPDPTTGRRQLEQIAFEVVSTESLGHAERKAIELIARGVRRVFAIDTRHLRLLEWSSSLAGWRVLESGMHIEDPVLAAPLSIDALVHAAKADDAMARALVIKRNPVIEAEKAHSREEGEQVGLATGRQEGLAKGRQEGLAKGRQEGLAKGRQEGLLAVLAARGIPLDLADRARILGEGDPERLDRWIERAAYCTSIADVLAEP